MYSTPTPLGRPSTLGGRGSKLTRPPPRVSPGTNLPSPTLSNNGRNNTNNVGRKSLSTNSSMPSNPASRSTSQQRSTSVSTNGSPESIRVGDTVRAPSGEIGSVK